MLCERKVGGDLREETYQLKCKDLGKEKIPKVPRGGRLVPAGHLGLVECRGTLSCDGILHSDC